MIKPIVMIVAASSVVVSAPAFAEGFDGPFMGVQAGYENTEVEGPNTEQGVITLDDSTDAFTGGLFFGYDKQVSSQFVFGVESGLDYSTGNTFDGTLGTTVASIDPQWSLDLTARAGYLVNPSSLVYVRAGYEYAEVDTTTASALGTELTDTEGRDAWILGVGYERELIDGVYGRVEYRYSDLSEGDGTWDRHRGLLGVSYRF